MQITSLRILPLALLLVAVLGCPRTAKSPPSSSSAAVLAGDWTLLELNAQPAPAGAGGHPATLHFAPDSSRVSGFAGCNRLTAGYTTSGDSLRFGAAAMTRMACPEGMELEQAFTEVLGETIRFQVNDAGLTLLGASGPVARFSRGAP
jgi:heat shock protein HslJ